MSRTLKIQHLSKNVDKEILKSYFHYFQANQWILRIVLCHYHYQYIIFCIIMKEYMKAHV